MSSTHVIPSRRQVVIERTMHVIECASCSIDFGIGANFMTARREDHATFYCPNGHSNYYSEPTKQERELASLREQRDASRSIAQRERERRHDAEQQAATLRAEDARLRWRVANGVCPCCQRRFTALADHMATKHPEFADVPITALSSAQLRVLAGIATAADDVDQAVVDRTPWDSRTTNALERRGLVEPLDGWTIALTEAGWRAVAAIEAD